MKTELTQRQLRRQKYYLIAKETNTCSNHPGRPAIRSYRCSYCERLQKDAKLRKLYGITIEIYESMLEKQNYVCKQCKKDEPSVDKRTNERRALAVDHCHDTGMVRGLLCSICNLGNCPDSIEWLFSRIRYLTDKSDWITPCYKKKPKYVPSAETRERMSIAAKTAKRDGFSSEHCRKISESKKGKPGRKLTEEEKRAISERVKLWWANHRKTPITEVSLTAPVLNS